MGRRRAKIGVALFSLVIVLAWWFLRNGSPPQIGANEAVVNSVDALFTAISVRDMKLVGECEERLHALKSAGTLPVDASDRLDDIIARARSGNWRPAAEKLYVFMKGQRRESR